MVFYCWKQRLTLAEYHEIHSSSYSILKLNIFIIYIIWNTIHIDVLLIRIYINAHTIFNSSFMLSLNSVAIKTKLLILYLKRVFKYIPKAFFYTWQYYKNKKIHYTVVCKFLGSHNPFKIEHFNIQLRVSSK